MKFWHNLGVELEDDTVKDMSTKDMAEYFKRQPEGANFVYNLKFKGWSKTKVVYVSFVGYDEEKQRLIGPKDMLSNLNTLGSLIELKQPHQFVLNDVLRVRKYYGAFLRRHIADWLHDKTGAHMHLDMPEAE